MPKLNEKKTCPKCKGAGCFPHFAHNNDPIGICWKCHGRKEVVWVTPEAHNELVDEIVALERERIEKEAAKIEDNFRRSRRTDEAVLNRRLEPLRHRWVQAGNGGLGKGFQKVSRGYWTHFFK